MPLMRPRSEACKRTLGHLDLMATRHCPDSEPERQEHLMIGLRTKEALAAAKAKGVKVGPPASQYPKVVRRIRGARAAGHTYRAIADRLNRDAVPLPGGGSKWHPNRVRNAGG